MPFTFSHPAIVVPLKKLKPSWFSLTGLIMGSIAPDLQYFLKMSTGSDFGHTLPGIFLIDLPLSFLVAIAFHLWVRNSLILHLPSPMDRKYADCLSFDFMQYLKRAWLVFAFSAFIGTLSHLFWDDFARPDGWVYYLNPEFFSQQVRVGPVHNKLYHLIERTGSVLGLVFLIWLLFRKEARETNVNFLSATEKLTFWGSILLGTASIVGLKLWSEKWSGSLSRFIVVLTSASLYALALVSALYDLFRPKVTKP
ncbi:uncharacterized protein DUF4184 [Pontibacter ummariensis]|uniref:DUF4184 family protein n=1 Tax=Pontibacter ummariensis TaxID=1610492 RepID=A0A239I560_9BACT|nr:DUF4184 family protein [Pontibacter ummariensis]PRY10224.1 uncharacterized protein DUF4184 [Pontibacter ummariensis]SNS88428.1 protein of unknown function [Pontibacter ummariensis]